MELDATHGKLLCMDLPGRRGFSTRGGSWDAVASSHLFRLSDVRRAVLPGISTKNCLSVNLTQMEW